MMALLFAALAMMASDKPEPTAEESAYELVNATKVATACTTHEKGPFGSVMPYALDAEGRPLIFISTLAVHTKNIDKNPKASLFVTKPSEEVKLDSPRVTLIGEFKKVPEKELKGVKEAYFKKYPDAKIYEMFHDFSFYRLEITDIYYVGGFGPKPIDWLDVDKYKKAAKAK